MTDFGFEEIFIYFHRGTLPEVEDELLNIVNEYDSYEKSVVYSSRVLEAHIGHVREVDYLDDITSSVARCVEYGLKDQLEILLKNLDKLVSLATHFDGVTILDRRLMLRKINTECYAIAAKHGFIDSELEARISIIQRILRKQDIQPIIYKGPIPHEYFCVDGVLDYEPSPRYWGYRHTLYFLKWNQAARINIAKLIKDHWWGDCRYQAYVDSLESGNGDNLDFKPSNYV